VPQAWAAGSVFHLLQAILGLDANAHKKSLYVDPELPRWLPDITLHNLRVGESTITLRFWKENKETRHEVLALEGDLLVQWRSGPRNLPNERAQLTHNGRFQDHRERGLASGLV
jgi:cellobiose phosphorylase